VTDERDIFPGMSEPPTSRFPPAEVRVGSGEFQILADMGRLFAAPETIYAEKEILGGWSRGRIAPRRAEHADSRRRRPQRQAPATDHRALGGAEHP